MDTLDRFLIREFFLYLVVVLVGLTSLYLGIDFLSKFWSSHTPIATTSVLYSYKIPETLQRFVPVASLMATLLVLTNMSRQNEILALYTGGIGIIRIASTLIAIIAVVCTVSFLTFDKLTPLFAKKHLLLSRGLDPNDDQLLTSKQGRFWYRSGNLVYKVGRFSPDQNTLEDLNVYILSPSSQLVQRIRAKKATYVNDDWILEDGFIVMYPQDTHYPVSKPFKTKRGIIPEKPVDFKSFEIIEETMELKELRRFINKNKTYGLDTTIQQVNYHERLALVFAPLIFVLLGIPFATNPLRTHSTAKSVGFCFLLVFIYLLSFRFSLSLGKGGQLPPFVAGWAPNVFFLVGAVLVLFRK